MTSIHNTKFLKADMRLPDPLANGRTYITTGDGIVIRDTFLPAAATAHLTLDKNAQNIIVPLVGSITAFFHDGAERILLPGELLYYADRTHNGIRITNMLPDEQINFLQITLPPANGMLEKRSIEAFNITAQNCLTPGYGAAKNIRVGVYEGRAQDIAHMTAGSSCLVYIVNGSFEVGNRLMEYRDSMLLWDTQEIEFEALSEAAIILLIEFSPPK